MTTAADVDRRPAYEQVADALRRRIVAGDLAVGDRLPSEDALADDFAVSRSTVREALRVLTSQNLVVTTRGVTGGTFIALPDAAQVADLLELGVGLLAVGRKIDVDQLLLVREALEVPAARLAAERAAAAPDALDASGLAAWAALPESGPARERFEASADFHRALLAASGNPLLEIVTRPVFTVLEQRFLRDRAPQRFWDHVHGDHVAIARAVTAGDAAAAVEAMRAHLHDLRDTYLDLEIA